MFKLARRLHLREIFSGGSSCTGDCGQGRRCTCNPDREESAGKPTNLESKLPIGKIMTREEIIRMAREAGDWNGQTAEFNDIGLERFAAFVAAHEQEKVAKWMVERGYATGHGDTVEDLLEEIDWQVAEREREGCAKIAETPFSGEQDDITMQAKDRVAAAIRARGNK